MKRNVVTVLAWAWCLLGTAQPYSVLAAEPTAKPIRPNLYSTEADGNRQIAEAITRATAEQKRIILKFGANW